MADIPALRENLAKFIQDPRTIKAFEELGNKALSNTDVAENALATAQDALTQVTLALALIELLSESSYVTLSANATLDNERVLVAGNLLSLTDGGSGGAATLDLESTTVGGNFVGLANPSAVTFPRINADNTVSALSAALFRAALGVPTLASGTYTPTLTIYNNIDATVAYSCQYLQVGSTVHVSGRVDIDPTATSALTVLGITLPVPSALTAAEQCAGSGYTSGVYGQGCGIFYDTSLSAVTLRYISGDATSRGMFFTFTYRVLP